MDESTVVVEAMAAVEAAGCTGWTTESTVKYRVAVIISPTPTSRWTALCRVVGAHGDRRHSHDYCGGDGVGDPRVAVGNSLGTRMIIFTSGNNLF